MSIFRGSLALACALGWIASASPALAQDTVKIGDGGLEYRAMDGWFRLELGGRLHLDAASVDDGTTRSDDEEVRRARLELSLRFGDKWRARIDREFAGGGGWRNLWLRYDVDDHLNIKAGNFIAPFSMEDIGSSNDLMFMERSLAQALAPGFGVGVAASYEGRQFSLSGGYFSDAVDAEDNIQAEKGKGFVARATWSPLERRSGTLHFGLGLEQREFGSADTRSISTSPEASLAPTILSTGALANLDSSTSYNLEAAYSAGPVLVQGQYIATSLARTAGADVDLKGGYAQVGWLISGERYDYADASGVFAAPSPKKSGWGALEIAARFSTLDLSDTGPAGGAKANDFTAGVNWYINGNVRLMGNYVHSEVDAVNPLLDQKRDIVEARLQFGF